MRELIAQFLRSLTHRRQRCIRVACVQPLAAGVTLYAIDVDGRRILMGASSNAVCLLDRYPIPPLGAAAGADAPGGKI